VSTTEELFDRKVTAKSWQSLHWQAAVAYLMLIGITRLRD
jgi:hypothetical protein